MYKGKALFVRMAGGVAGVVRVCVVSQPPTLWPALYIKSKDDLLVWIRPGNFLSKQINISENQSIVSFLPDRINTGHQLLTS
jgi:hypothetical protein